MRIVPAANAWIAQHAGGGLAEQRAPSAAAIPPASAIADQRASTRALDQPLRTNPGVEAMPSGRFDRRTATTIAVLTVAPEISEIAIATDSGTPSSSAPSAMPVDACSPFGARLLDENDRPRRT